MDGRLCDNAGCCQTAFGANYTAPDFGNASCGARGRSDVAWPHKPHGSLRCRRAPGSSEYACHSNGNTAVPGFDAFIAKFGKPNFSMPGFRQFSQSRLLFHACERNVIFSANAALHHDAIQDHHN